MAYKKIYKITVKADDVKIKVKSEIERMDEEIKRLRVAIT